MLAAIGNCFGLFGPKSIFTNSGDSSELVVKTVSGEDNKTKYLEKIPQTQMEISTNLNRHAMPRDRAKATGRKA